MKKPSEKQAATAVSTGCPDAQWASKYPHICEYLSSAVWEDGSAREPSALSVSIRDGMIALALNDKELKQSMYTQAGSVAEALKLMEGALAGGIEAWRPWKAGKRK
jgi:hypothetical protein